MSAVSTPDRFSVIDVRARKVPIAGGYETATLARSRGDAARARHCCRKVGECSSAQRIVGSRPASSSIESGRVSAGASQAETRAATAAAPPLGASVASVGARNDSDDTVATVTIDAGEYHMHLPRSKAGSVLLRTSRRD